MKEILKKILITAEEIDQACKELGANITKDYQGKKVVLIGLLKGCIPFIGDLAKYIDLDLEVQYMVVSSYRGGTSSGELQIKYDLESSINGYDVLIIEDIVDSGKTLETIQAMLMNKGANSVEVVTLLNKIANNNLKPKYVGFEIENEFVVGYGLDFQEKYRNIPYIGILKEEYYD